MSKELIIEGLSNLYRIPDGSSYAYGTLTCEEKDPQVQQIVDVNKGQNNGKCYLEEYKYLRMLKLNSNAFTNIDNITALPYLLDL